MTRPSDTRGTYLTGSALGVAFLPRTVMTRFAATAMTDVAIMCVRMSHHHTRSYAPTSMPRVCRTVTTAVCAANTQGSGMHSLNRAWRGSATMAMLRIEVRAG